MLGPVLKFFPAIEAIKPALQLKAGPVGLEVGGGAVAQQEQAQPHPLQPVQHLGYAGIQLCPALPDQGQHLFPHLSTACKLFLPGQVGLKAVPHLLGGQADPLANGLPGPSLGRGIALCHQGVIGRLDGGGVNGQAVVEGAVVVKEQVDHAQASRERIRLTISMAP